MRVGQIINILLVTIACKRFPKITNIVLVRLEKLIRKNLLTYFLSSGSRTPIMSEGIEEVARLKYETLNYGRLDKAIHHFRPNRNV